MRRGLKIGANQKRILKLLARHGALHGYRIIKEFARERGISSTKEMLRLSGIVYPAVQGLVEKGLVRAVEKNGRKYYTITESGLKFLEELEEKGERIEIGKGILFLVLGERADLVAFKYCLRMARAIGSKVYCVYMPNLMLDRVTVSSKLVMEEDAYEKLVECLTRRGREAVKPLRQMAAASNVVFEWHIAYGDVEKVVLDFVKRMGVEVVVVSGESLLKIRKVKSLLSRLVSTSPCPLVIVPKRYSG